MFFGAILAANHLRLSTCSRARCHLNRIVVLDFVRQLQNFL
jgi:hypothetical protein